MARDIRASYRNKGFITSIVTAFEERDLPAFTALFAQHADPAQYKIAKDNKNPSDYQLFCELHGNRKSQFDQEDMHTLLLTLCAVPAISPLTKVALYLASFPYVTVAEREQHFGSTGPFVLADAVEGYKAFLQPLENWEKNNVRELFRTLYLDSVVKDQSPEDFVAKFKLSQELDLTAFAAIKQLDYEDAEQGPTAMERYQLIFASVDEQNAEKLLWNLPKKAISYDMIKAYGPAAFYADAKDYGLPILKLAFKNGDTELFSTLSAKALHNANPNEWREFTKELLAEAEASEYSETQKQILSTMDAAVHQATIEQFQDNVAGNNWHGPAGFVMECLLEGNLRVLQEFMKHERNVDFRPFFSAVIHEFDNMLPLMMRGGVIGERQKQAALFIHEQATQNMATIAERIQEIDTSKAYRLQKMNEDRMVSIPLSELTPEQRDQWAEGELDMSRPDLRGVMHMMHPRRRHGGGFEPN
jgi:hypothetical protein